MVTTRKRRGLAAWLLLSLLFCGALTWGAGATPAAALGISGQVLDDSNLNRRVDPTDRPLSLVEVRLLDANGGLVAVSLTDVLGQYRFDNVAAGGSYLITTIPPFATVSETVQPGPGAVPAGVNGIFVRNVQAGTDYPNNSFLQRQFQVVSPVTPETPNTISGQVIQDLNGSGAVDAGEPGLGGAVLTLVSAAGVALGSTTSAPTGEFTFAGLANGDYFLTETDPAGFASTGAVAGVGGVRLDANTIRVTATAGVTLYSGQLFLDRATGIGPVPGPGSGPNRIEGFVFSDANGNNFPGRGDQPLIGVTITLKNAVGAPVAGALTDSNGMFVFSGLATGVYLLTETDPPGYVSVDASPGTAGVKIDENNVRITISDGLVSYAGTVFLDRVGSTPSPGGNVITGAVFNDASGNGIIDPGEGPLAGVTVSLRDAASNLIATTFTSVAGTFAFVGLANGSYTLVETDPPGFVSVASTPGVGGQVVDANTIRVTTIDGIVTYAGNTFLDRQVAPPTPGPNTISGLVVNDANANGVPDAGEAPLAGAVITLQNSVGQLIASAATGPDGSFVFGNLADGTYTLVETDPAGFSSTAAVAGVGGQGIDANSIRITTVPGLTSYPGQLFLDQNGGAPPPAAAPAILSVTPQSGGPGSTVTISGRGFGAGPVQVLFGATPGTILSSSALLNSIVVLVPDLPAGPTPLAVVNSAGASNPVAYTVTAPGPRAALGPLFLASFAELGNQKGLGQVAPAMEVVIAQSLGFAQNQAVSGNVVGAISTLRSLLVRVNRSPAALVTPAARGALAGAINALIAQLQAQP